MRRFLLLPATLLALVGPGDLASQTSAQLPVSAVRALSLREALTLADSQAWANRIAGAQASAAAADRDRTLRGILPTVRAEAGWMRTTDPLNAFGFALRQRGVSEASFDPARLNQPDPISSFGTGLVLEQPLLNPDVWLGRMAASKAALATEAQARWTATGTRLQVVAAYYGGVMAREKVGALEVGHAAARSHVRMAQSLHRQGMVTRSDVLLAEVKAGEVEAQLAAARGDLALARFQLATALGSPADTGYTLPEALPALDRIAALAGMDADQAPRADLAAARLGLEAADRNYDRARATLLPRINSFARYDWNDPSSVAGGRPAWTVGVMASWALFSGGSELADQRAARAQREAARAMVEAAEAGARLDVAARRNELDVALATAAIAERAVGQSAEAERIVARKYEGGLATVTELLEATAIATRTRLEFAGARYRAILAAGGWHQAIGGDLMTLTHLDHETR